MFTSRLLDNKDPAIAPRSGSPKLETLQRQLLDSGVEKDPHLSVIRDKLNTSGIRSGKQRPPSNVTARTPSGNSVLLNSRLQTPTNRTRSHDLSNISSINEDKRPTGPPSSNNTAEMLQLAVPRVIQGPYGMPLIQTEVPTFETTEFPPKNMANPFRNSTSLRDANPPIAPRKDNGARPKFAVESIPTVTNNYEIGVLAQEPSKFFFDDPPREVQKNPKPPTAAPQKPPTVIGNPDFFAVPKVTRNIPRQQQMLFDLAKRTNTFPMGPKRPLYVMNLTVDSGTQKKIYVFEDTHPWQKAYEFVEVNNLEDEMVPLIADLIETDKQRYMAGRQMESPHRDNYKRVETPSTGYTSATTAGKPPRSQNEIGERGARQPAFDQVVLEKPPILPVAGGSKFEGFHLGQRPQILDSMVDSQTDWNPPAAVQPRPTGNGLARTNSQPVLASVSQSPSAPVNPPTQRQPVLQDSSVGYSPDSFYLKDSGPVQMVAPHILNFVQKMQPSTPVPTLTAEDDTMLRRIFGNIDVEQRGVIKSFEVSLSTLPRELRTLIGSLLKSLDEQASGPTGGFESISYDSFVRAVVQSGKLPDIKQIYVRI